MTATGQGDPRTAALAWRLLSDGGIRSDEASGVDSSAAIRRGQRAGMSLHIWEKIGTMTSQRRPDVQFPRLFRLKAK